MRARTVSRQGASTSGDGSLDQFRSLRSHAHPRIPSIASPLQPPTQLPRPVPRRVRADAARHPAADPRRARLRPRLPRLHQPPEHGPDRRQLRGEQPGGLGRRHRTRRSRRRYENQILGDAAATNCTLPRVGRQAGDPEAEFIDGERRRQRHGLGDSVKVAAELRLRRHHAGHLEHPGRHRAGLRRVELPGQGRAERRRQRRRRPRCGRRRRTGGGLQRQPRHHAQHDLGHDAVRRRVPGHLRRIARPPGRGTSTTARSRRRRTRSSTRSRRQTRATSSTSRCWPATSSASGVATMDVVVIGTSDVDFTASTHGHREPGRRSRSPTRPRRAARTTPGPSATAARRTGHDGAAHLREHGRQSVHGLAHRHLSRPDRRRDDDQAGLHHRQRRARAPCPRSTASSSTTRRPRGTRQNFTGVVARAPGAPNGNFTINAQSQTASFNDPVLQRRRGERTSEPPRSPPSPLRRRGAAARRSSSSRSSSRSSCSSLVALFDLGRAVFSYNTLTNAAREGARMAIVNQDKADDRRAGEDARPRSSSSTTRA